MFGCDDLNRFQLDDHFLLNEQIRIKFTHAFTTKRHVYRVL
jgi:hypothetical protein